jgi:hypothetical protein
VLTRFCLPLVAISWLAGCKGYELDRKTFSDDTIQWGEPVNGLQVGIARREFVSGAAPAGSGVEYYSVHLKNVTKRELTILSPVALKGNLPEDLAGDESVHVKLFYDTGAAGGVKTGEFKPVKRPVIQVMEPGMSYALELRLAPEKFGLRRFEPGRLSAVYSNRQESIRYKTMGDQPVRSIWTGEAKSGTVIVEPAAATTRSASAGGAER